MKTSVEDISSVKKKITIEIPEDRVTNEIDSFYLDLGKKAAIKGFRPGKVPRNILERRFKDYVKAEVLQKLIQGTYPEALSEMNLQPVSDPEVDPGDIESGKPFQYSATVEVRPEIKIENYSGLNLEGKKEEVQDEEVEERLKGLQNHHSTLKTVTETRPIQNGDFVIVDYESTMDGKPLEEGRAVDYTVEMGGERFIPGLEEKLVGLNPEEEKEIEVTFPGDYGYKKWAGKAISFHVKIKEIKEKILPVLDDEFATDLGHSSMEELKARLREDIQREKALVLERQLKDQIVDRLLDMNPFEVPEALVEEQSKALVSDTRLRLASQGMAFEKLGVSEEKLTEDYREMAKKQVRTYLVLEKIGGQEGITVTDEEVEERLRDISERSHQKIDALKRYYEKSGLIPEVKAGIMSEKILKFLLEKANINYTT